MAAAVEERKENQNFRGQPTILIEEVGKLRRLLKEIVEIIKLNFIFPLDISVMSLSLIIQMRSCRSKVTLSFPALPSHGAGKLLFYGVSATKLYFPSQ